MRWHCPLTEEIVEHRALANHSVWIQRRGTHAAYRWHDRAPAPRMTATWRNPEVESRSHELLPMLLHRAWTHAEADSELFVGKPAALAFRIEHPILQPDEFRPVRHRAGGEEDLHLEFCRAWGALGRSGSGSIHCSVAGHM